jgi:ferredoxin
MFKVQLQTRLGTLEFEASQNKCLIDCADEFEIEIPSSCRNGTCRTCISKTLEGSVRYEIGWPGLSAEEKAEGWILPCVAIACSDLKIENEDAYLI